MTANNVKNAFFNIDLSISMPKALAPYPPRRAIETLLK
jgi:hypothetical protein